MFVTLQGQPSPGRNRVDGYIWREFEREHRSEGVDRLFGETVGEVVNAVLVGFAIADIDDPALHSFGELFGKGCNQEPGRKQVNVENTVELFRCDRPAITPWKDTGIVDQDVHMTKTEHGLSILRVQDILSPC